MDAHHVSGERASERVSEAVRFHFWVGIQRRAPGHPLHSVEKNMKNDYSCWSKNNKALNFNQGKILYDQGSIFDGLFVFIL